MEGVSMDPSSEGTKANQLIKKFVISLTTGRILGYVTDINVEVEGNRFFFILKMKLVENLGKGSGMFSSEKKMRISPEDIVNVGPDVIILGDGKVPPLREIEELVKIKEEYEELKEKLRERDILIKSLKSENQALRRRVEELEHEARKLEVMRDDFEHLKEQLIKQEGELEMAREYIKLLEGMRHDIDSIKESFEGFVTADLEKTVRNIIDEELNARGLKKTSFI